MSSYNMQPHREYWATKRGHLSRYLAKAKMRAKEKGLPLNIDIDYLESIATDNCPVFNQPFVWGQSRLGRHVQSEWGPSLDRVVPELGYIKGNVVFISRIANSIKQNATEVELYAVADWLHDKRKEVLNAFPGQSAPLPTPGARISKKDPEPGATHGAGPGQDCDGAQHHQAELFGADPGGCA